MVSRAASVFASILATGLALYACGGGGAESSPDSGTIDGSVEAATDDSGSTSDDGGSISDAPPDMNQDPNVYPAMHHPLPQVDRGTGPLIDHPKLVTVTFAGDPTRDANRAFDRAIGGTNWWQSTLVPYGISPSQVVDEVELPDTLSGTSMFDPAFETYLAAQVQSGALPPPDAETLYVIYPTPTTTIVLAQGFVGCGAGLFGYHYSFTVAPPQPDGGAQDAGPLPDVIASYAVIFNCGGYESNTTVASHEIAEACTNPQPGGTVTYLMTKNVAWPEPSGGEVGDLCVQLPSIIEGGYELQRIYSNTAAALSQDPCQPAPATYFAGALRTTMTASTQGFKDGYVPVTLGQSTDVLIDVFSQAALSSDVTLSVGTISFAGGVETFTPLPTSFMSLSSTTAHNGDAVVLTINASANMPTSRYPFVLRAALGPNDTNDWPFVLFVE